MVEHSPQVLASEAKTIIIKFGVETYIRPSIYCFYHVLL